MNIKISVGNSSELIKKSQGIRNTVFVKEQGIPIELDLDGLDRQSYHALAQKGKQAVGTARLTLAGDKQAVLARVAVMKNNRGLGIASQLVQSLLSYAGELDIKTIDIHAHKYLRGYYESFGFKYIQEVEVVGEHQLIEMRLSY